LRFLVDAQLPPGLARRLSSAGHDAVHLYEILPPETKDVDVAGEANRRGAILVSKDEDFVDLSRRGILTAPLLWLRLGNMTTAGLWQKLAPLLPEVESAFAAGDRIVEIR
jgi:predicted nuclease of predicted toxin-antitoxin system